MCSKKRFPQPEYLSNFIPSKDRHSKKRPAHSLSAPSLLNTIYETFKKVEDPRTPSRQNQIPLTDHLMSGLAIFGLKFPSLLQYDRQRKDTAIAQNLKNLYHVQTPPSDTYLRERLDEVDPKNIRIVFKKLFSVLQRSTQLEEFVFMGEYYLLPIDGTGKFSSSKICCPHCCKKVSSKGEETYYHQMLGACIVHPDRANVIPLCPEPILNGDGHEKNDCERNSAKRFIEHFRREHPHLKVIVVEDGLSSNAPHIEMLKKHDMRFILGAKRGDHKYLFEMLDDSERTKYYEFEDANGTVHQFHFLNDVSLNKSNSGLKVNVIEYRETTKNGKETNFSWVTDMPMTEKNVYEIMRGGRARWKIENETFNTLKNLGYNFEHNYGHGMKYLSTVLGYLMILAFFIDQIQEISCQYYREAKKRVGTYKSLWRSMQTLFEYFVIESWEEFYLFIAKKTTLDSS